jgi:hypothetical protein
LQSTDQVFNDSTQTSRSNRPQSQAPTSIGR